jgi:hypothetical protein
VTAEEVDVDKAPGAGGEAHPGAMTGVLNFIGERKTKLAKEHAIVKFKVESETGKGRENQKQSLANGGIRSTHPHGDDEP